MIQCKVLLNSIDKVKDFTNAASKCTEEIEVQSGLGTADAKSTLGVLALDIIHPLTVLIHSDDEGIVESFKPFIVG